MKKFSLGLVWKSLKDSFGEFGNDKIPKLSAALAYYTGFSLAPLLVVIIAISGLVFGQQAVEGSIQEQIGSIIGPDAAAQVEQMIKNASLSGKSVLATVVGGLTLLIGASTIFGEIQDSINSIWGLKQKPSVGFMKTVKTRLLSFGIIGSLGFILLVSLAASAILEGLGDRLQSIFPNVTFVLFYVLNLVLTLSVITFLFAVIFKVLPDANIRWRAVLPGAIATALLFMIGKLGISLYISKSDLGSSFGAASSLAVIFVWIYYSSIILYFGAEFTKSYALNRGFKIVPNQYAQWDERPAVPGAAAKKRPDGNSPSEKEQRPERRQHVPPLAMAEGKREKYERPDAVRTAGETLRERTRKEEKPGMGSVLLGLALYLATRGNSKPGR